MPLNHVHFGLPLGKFTQMSDYVNPEATDDGCPFWKKSRFSFVPPTVNFCSSRHGEVPEQDANIRKKLLWCSSSLFPKIVKRMLVDNGFSIVPASEPWLGYWGHRHKVSEFVALMPYQKVNHFPGNFLLGRKDRLSSNIDQMAKRWKKQEFTFVPETYILPSQRRALLARMKRRASQCDVFIMKPPSSSRGNGIRLINKARNVPEQKPLIVQRYITNPYLINGFKFDLRLYVLVSSWKPLRAYLYEEGIVRFASCKCGHCVKLAPEYEKAAKSLAKRHPPIPLAKVDATMERQLATEHQVSGYPTMKVFRYGRAYEYRGGRNTEGIVSYMEEMSMPAVRELKDPQELKRIKNDETLVVGLFKNKKQLLYENFVEAGEELRQHFKHLFFSFAKSVKEHFASSAEGEIIVAIPELLMTKYESKQKSMSRLDASKEDIVKFVTESSVPLVGHRTMANEAWAYSKGRKALVVAYYGVDFGPEFIADTQYWREKIAAVAKVYPSYVFAISNEQEFNHELKDIHLDDSGMDINVIAYGVDGRRFKMDPDEYGDFDEDALRDFMAKVNTGRVKAFMKSEKPPRSQTGPVAVVVGSTFRRIVYDESKDVLIELYAPWCGHCKALEPIYEELAKSLKSISGLVIAKMNAVENDSDDKYPVGGFPTIYLALKGQKKNPIQYTGERTVKAMTDFLKKHSDAFSEKSEL